MRRKVVAAVCIATVAVLAAAAVVLSPRPAEVCASPSEPLQYTTSWIGNSIARGSDHVPQGLDDIDVQPDGTVFTNIGWEEGGYQVTQFDTQGELVTAAGHTHGWGQAGGSAVAANADYLFFAQTIGNEDGGLSDSTTWPTGDVDWYGISRRPRADITTAIPFPDATGGAGDTLAGSFLRLDETSEDGSVSGLAADADKLYVAMPRTSSILVLDPSTMRTTRRWTDLPGFANLALDPTGKLWGIQVVQAGASPRIVGLSPEGQIAMVPDLGDGVVPVDLAFDRSGRLLVADNGVDQNVKIYSLSLTDGSMQAPLVSIGSSLVSGPTAQRGVVGGARFLGLTGVGVDDSGNIVVSSSLGSDRGVLEKFSASGERIWARYGIPFVDGAAMDPGAESDVYSADARYTMDWESSAPGSEWQLRSVTLDPIAFPSDPRTSGFTQPILRRLNGDRLYLFTSDMFASSITAYRFDTANLGEIAVLASIISKDDTIARDLNGDGSISESETVSKSNPVAHGDATWGFWVDDHGDVWQTINADDQKDAELRRYRLQGFDRMGAPMYDFAHIDSYAVPAPFSFEINGGLERVVYDAETDTMTLAGYPPNSAGEAWGAFREVARYENWSTGNRTPRWSISVPYDEEEQIVPIALAATGDYVFVGGVGTRSKIDIYCAADGSPVGSLTPNNGLFQIEDTGWIDVRPFGISVAQRADGEYVIFVEEDENIKTIVYRWRP